MTSIASMWSASLSLELEHRQHRTVMARCRHRGPLRVQRPLYPEDACHIYVLHPPGGVVGGDVLDIDVVAKPEACALITTPAAGKLYRSDRHWASVQNTCRVHDGAMMEWFPGENIVYDRAWAKLNTEIHLAPTASFIGWDIVCLGRPAAGERFACGTCWQRTVVRRGDDIVWMEHNRYEGGSQRLQAPWGLAGFSVCGTMICASARPLADTLVAMLRADPNLNDVDRDNATGHRQDDDRRHLWGVTALGQIVVCRYLGHQAAHARDYFTRAWSLLRPHLTGKGAVFPRIWAT